MVERGALGVWVVGEAGAALLTGRRGRRATCFCVRVADPDLPRADRIAHLLLALRADEVGFATVANMAFSGARWRVRASAARGDAAGPGGGGAVWEGASGEFPRPNLALWASVRPRPRVGPAVENFGPSGDGQRAAERAS